MNDYLTAVKNRRTFYNISKETTIADERLQAIIAEAVNHTPSPFNSQSSRVVILLGEQHDRLWEIVKSELKKVVRAENFAQTEAKVNSFASGYGSVLFFEDMTVVKGLQDRFPLYKDNFAIWSQHSSGMLQHVVWTALTAEGLGASLQHYAPLIDASVKEAWNIPDSWQLVAQMPFGKPTAEPDTKEFQPIEQRLKLYK